MADYDLTEIIDFILALHEAELSQSTEIVLGDNKYLFR